jgi:hypothetical protein
MCAATLGLGARPGSVTPRICTTALAYPRGELPFIAEWLEYHLALGVDHVFLGLHFNEDLIDPHNYLTESRPFPEMYDLAGTEADVVDRFLAEIRPFRSHVTSYLLHRLASEPAGHREEQQRHLYNSVLGMQREAYDWICPHDIDEYIVPQEPYETIPAALAECPDRYSAIVMEQTIVRPRWDETRHPRPAPLIVPDLPRCAEIVPLYHGIKTFARCRAAASLDIHAPGLLADCHALADRRLLHYHFHGFPADTDAPPARVVPIDHQVFDVVDDRPWRLRRRALGAAP